MTRLPRTTIALLALLYSTMSAAAGCGRVEAEDVIRPLIVEARFVAQPSKPFEGADVHLVVGLQAGSRAKGQTAALEYARLFEGSTWRTTEPAVHLGLRMPESAGEPFEPGESREVTLEGHVPNRDLEPYCDGELTLLVAIRTSGLHSLLGVTDDVRIGCEPGS